MIQSKQTHRRTPLPASRQSAHYLDLYSFSISLYLGRTSEKQVILCQTPDTLSGVCETLKLYKPYGVTFSKIGFWDGPQPAVTKPISVECTFEESST